MRTPTFFGESIGDRSFIEPYPIVWGPSILTKILPFLLQHEYLKKQNEEYFSYQQNPWALFKKHD